MTADKPTASGVPDKLPPCPLCGKQPKREKDGRLICGSSACPLTPEDPFVGPVFTSDEWRRLAAVDLREENERLRAHVIAAESLVGQHAARADALAAEVERLNKLEIHGETYVHHSRLDAAEAGRDAAEKERDEIKKLLAPEVLAAARLIALNADAHPNGCCHKCRAGLAHRDRLLAALREIVECLGMFYWDTEVTRARAIAAAAIAEEEK